MPKPLRILCLVFLWGCSSGATREGEVVIAEASLPVSFEVVGEGASASAEAPREAVVRARAAWEALRPLLVFRQAPRPVDLSGAMLLVAAIEVPRSGHAVRFESVEEDSSGVVATYTVFTPGNDCLTDATPQRPFQVVRLRSLGGPVRFVRHDEALPCSPGRW